MWSLSNGHSDALAKDLPSVGPIYYLVIVDAHHGGTVGPESLREKLEEGFHVIGVFYFDWEHLHPHYRVLHRPGLPEDQLESLVKIYFDHFEKTLVDSGLAVYRN